MNFQINPLILCRSTLLSGNRFIIQLTIEIVLIQSIVDIDVPWEAIVAVVTDRFIIDTL